MLSLSTFINSASGNNLCVCSGPFNPKALIRFVV